MGTYGSPYVKIARVYKQTQDQTQQTVAGSNRQYISSARINEGLCNPDAPLPAWPPVQPYATSNPAI